MKLRETDNAIVGPNGQLIVCCVNGGNTLNYYVNEGGVWQRYDEKNVTRRLKLIGITDQETIDITYLRIQRENMVSFASKIAGLKAGIYEVGNSQNRHANTTILSTVSSELIEGESGECKTIMGFLEHALGHTPDQLDTFLLDIKKNRSKLRRNQPWMGHFNILLGDPQVGKSLVQQQLYGQAYNGLTADCWEYIAEGKRFNKTLVAACTWTAEDSCINKYTATRLAMTERIKHIASTFHENYEPKYVDAFRVELNRYGSLSANFDVESVNSLPMLREDTKDKLNFFLFSDSLVIPNFDLKTNDPDNIKLIFDSERKAFHHLIDNYKEPIELVGTNDRYGCKSFHHKKVLEIMKEADPATALLDLLCIDEVWGNLFKAHGLCQMKDSRKVLEKTEVLMSGIELECCLKDSLGNKWELYRRQHAQGWVIGNTLAKLQKSLPKVIGKFPVEKKRHASGVKWAIRHTIKENFADYASSDEYEAEQSKELSESVL